MFTLFVAVETTDNLRSDGSSLETAMADAIAMFQEEGGKPIKIRICPMKNGEIFYDGNKTCEIEAVIIR